MPAVHRRRIMQAVIIVVSVMLVVWNLPRSGKQLPPYIEGSPWLGNQIIAPFNFAVMKNQDAIKAMEDSVRSAFLPYYNFNHTVEENEIGHFRSAISSGQISLPHGCDDIVEQLLRRHYQMGVMSTADYNAVFTDSTRQIRLITGKRVTNRTISEVFSQKQVYEAIMTDAQLSTYRQQLQHSNLNEYIEPNLSEDSLRSNSELTEEINSLVKADGMVVTGQKIIDRGDIVTPHIARVLASYEHELELRNTSQKSFRYVLVGQIVLVVAVFLFLTVYLALFRHDYFDKMRSFTMLYTVVTILPMIMGFFTSHVLLSVYIIPVAIAPMFIRIFLDSRTAFMAHVAVVMLCSLCVRNQFDFVLIYMTGGVIAIYSLRELTSRAQIYRSATLVVLGIAVVYTALQMIETGDKFVSDITTYKHFVVSGVFLLLAYPLMYLVEKVFGFTSDVTLFEISNSNQGLLRRLGQVAPSTLVHSITVANLAAEIANRIGGEALLVRTGALYHDIGKMSNPVFFTENQKGTNPHDSLPPQKSAQIIISHVTEGVRMAEQEGLPREIIDFIRTHHGEGVPKYFYIKYKNEHQGEEVPIDDFKYPGPNPFTKEQAILMMSDSVEAASHSLKEYTADTISEMVNRIVDGQMADGFFRECDITFRDIAIAKQVLTEQLMATYHTRISYPDAKK